MNQIIDSQQFAKISSLFSQNMKLVDQKLQIEREYHQKQIAIQQEQNSIVQQALQLQISSLQNQLDQITSNKAIMNKQHSQTHNKQNNEILSCETDVKSNMDKIQQPKDAQQQYMDELNSFSVQFAKDLISQRIDQLTANTSCESQNDKLEYVLNQYDLLKSQNALLIQTINDHTQQLDSLHSQTATLNYNNIQMQNTCNQCVEEVNGSLQQYNLEITQINNHYVVVPMNSEEVELVLNEDNVVVKVNAKTTE
ncbi:Hypothetical_protein [Hexamita inflata]|uniref:Hypothetical_protein n=1 Tax=Hexamita inflata TaxID=28002 RepID=A0AA86UJC8_9EUKA|nr:Hypothetical protein HINF_LOCUS29853 [Hexamita inflata]